MQLIKELFSVNEILTVSIVGWFVAQVLKTIINFILLGKFQLERMWGDGGMPSAHSATVCAMVIAAARSEGVSSAIFAVASVVAIITMHDAMGVRHETGEQAKVLNQMIDALATYNCVSVADLYDLVGMTSNYTDNKYGWYDLRTAYIQGVSGGYVIRLPKPVALNN